MNFVLALTDKIKFFKDLNKQVVAGVSDGIKDLSDYKYLAFLSQQLENQLESNMVRLGTTI